MNTDNNIERKNSNLTQNSNQQIEFKYDYSNVNLNNIGNNLNYNNHDINNNNNYYNNNNYNNNNNNNYYNNNNYNNNINDNNIILKKKN